MNLPSTAWGPSPSWGSPSYFPVLAVAPVPCHGWDTEGAFCPLPSNLLTSGSSHAPFPQPRLCLSLSPSLSQPARFGGGCTALYSSDF